MSPQRAASSPAADGPCSPGQLGTLSGPYYQGMASRSRFTLDEARAAGERIGVD